MATSVPGNISSGMRAGPRSSAALYVGENAFASSWNRILFEKVVPLEAARSAVSTTIVNAWRAHFSTRARSGSLKPTRAITSLTSSASERASAVASWPMTCSTRWSPGRGLGGVHSPCSATQARWSLIDMGPRRLMRASDALCVRFMSESALDG